MNRDWQTLSLEYLDFVRTQPCSCTMREPAEVSHLKHAKGYKGKPYHRHFAAIPMTHDVHMDWHNMDRKKFEKKYNVNVWQENVRTLIRFLTGKEMQ